MAKIVEKTERILFSDGTIITDKHKQDCCEVNYADFNQLDDVALSTDFDTANLIFEACGYGFRFGNAGKMFFVPCYSDQNGYYSTNVDICLNGETVLDVEGKVCGLC